MGHDSESSFAICCSDPSTTDNERTSLLFVPEAERREVISSSGSRMDNPPLRSGSRMDNPPLRSGSRMDNPPLRSGSRMDNPPLRSGSRMDNPPLRSGSRMDNPPLRSGSRMDNPPLRSGRHRGHGECKPKFPSPPCSPCLPW